MTRPLRPRPRAITTAALAVALIVLAGLVPAAAERPNGAGMVVRHGDGTLIYAYVQFDEESISGIDLLARSGLDQTLAPFGGLGAGVCSLDGEGCPSDNCWCQSYTNPAYYWHYYTFDGGTWVEEIRGPSSRVLHDGDIDGWSWTSGDGGLPAATIDEIAALNGVDRNAPEPTPTATETSTATATAESSPTPEPPKPAAPATITPAPSPSPTSDPPTGATATRTPATPTPPTQVAAVPSSSPTARPATATPAGGAPATPAPTRAPTSIAVVVNPSGTVTVLDTGGDSGGSSSSYILFGLFAAIALGGGAFAVLRARRVS